MIWGINILLFTHVFLSDSAVEITTSSHRYNGTELVEDGLHKDLSTAALYTIGKRDAESNRQPAAQDELQGEKLPKTAGDSSVTLLSDTKTEEEEEKAMEPPVSGNDGLQSSSIDRAGPENLRTGLYIPWNGGEWF